MAKADYDSHIELLDSSFSRMSSIGHSFENAEISELDALSDLETVLRIGFNSDSVLTDMQGPGFNGNFYMLLQKRVFKDFLEFKKASLDMTIEGFMNEQQYLRYREDNEDDEEYSDSTSVDEEKYIEPDEGYVDRVNNVSGGMSPKDIDEHLDIEQSELYTLPLGVDDDGFDVWCLPEEGIEEHESELAEEFNFDDLDDLETTEDSPLLTEPLGVDEDGYDIWSLPEPEDTWGELLSEHHGIDDDGYDIWHDGTSDIEDFETSDEVDDGFDHSEDQDRVALGELKSTWQGTDEDGYDIWVEPGEEGPSIEDVPTEDGRLGILNTSPQGVDDDGFDIWTAPITSTEPESAASVTPSPGTVPSRRGTRTSGEHFSPLKNSSRSRSSEDRTAEMILNSADKVGKLGKKFMKFMTS